MEKKIRLGKKTTGNAEEIPQKLILRGRIQKVSGNCRCSLFFSSYFSFLVYFTGDSKTEEEDPLKTPKRRQILVSAMDDARPNDSGSSILDLIPDFEEPKGPVIFVLGEFCQLFNFIDFIDKPSFVVVYFLIKNGRFHGDVSFLD